MRTCEQGACNKPAAFRSKVAKGCMAHNDAVCQDHKEAYKQQNNVKDEDFVDIRELVVK